MSYLASRFILHFQSGAVETSDYRYLEDATLLETLALVIERAICKDRVIRIELLAVPSAEWRELCPLLIDQDALVAAIDREFFINHHEPG